MLIYCDKAVEQRLTGFTKVDDSGRTISVVPMSKDRHVELRDKATYPSITWQRIDRVFDQTRFVSDPVLFQTKDEEGLDVTKVYEAPDPYNVQYQIELIAKERYDADMLDDFIDKVFRPRGDTLPIMCHIEDTNEDKIIKFPVDVVEARTLNDYEDPKNIYYRRIVTINVQLFVDAMVELDGGYTIKNRVIVEELDDPILN